MRKSAVSGLIFANANDNMLKKLTANRSMASVPFGARYRIIDFALSNLVNAGANSVGIITKENYRSLMDHVGNGVAWDLDRKSGGLSILPPYLTTDANMAEWGTKVIAGEQKRMSLGGVPIYNPTIAKVKVHFDIFMQSYEKQKDLQLATTRSLETLAAMREEADALILDVWNQVEKKYENITPNEKRLDMCRDYGLVYYYRTGETKPE